MTNRTKTPKSPSNRSPAGSPPAGGAHIVSIGTTPPTTREGEPDVIDVIASDIARMKPGRVVALATADSVENAQRLLKGTGVADGCGEVVEIASPQSLDDAYHATVSVIHHLEAAGVPRSRIVVHYTAGTKVMSAGMVLAAVTHDCVSLRYIYSQGRGRKSTPVDTSTAAVRAGGALNLARHLMRDMRFLSARDVLASVDPPLLSEDERREHSALLAIAPAYSAWDNFRVRAFLRVYGEATKHIAKTAPAFALKPEAVAALKKIARVDQTEGIYPVELLHDLYNNSLRRLTEWRTDDALIRLYRSAELFAQNILRERHGIRTDDVDIRKVPPRNRVIFEALRRLDNTKIALGLRKSYELLSYLEDPVGRAFLSNQRLLDVLDERRHLVLGHGTRPAKMQTALDMVRHLLEIFEMESPDFRSRAAVLQFPWLDNERILSDVAAAPEPTVFGSHHQGEEAGSDPAKRKPRNRSRSRKS